MKHAKATNYIKNVAGLNDDQVRKNRAQFGVNTIKTEKQNKLWLIVRGIITEPMFILLVCTAILYFVLGNYNSGTVMLVAVCFVSGIGIYQEIKSRTAVENLKKLSAPHASVIRNGDIIKIATDDIVIDDIIVVESGMIVPADATLQELHDFSVNESNLTGESLPVTKELQGEDNRIYQGTDVISGYCIAKVTAIGAQTELGKISQSLHEIKKPQTPLQQQIRKFVRSMVIIGIFAFFIVWGINYYLSKSILHGLLHGLTMAMSVLPEEIPVAFSTFMALGAFRLYKKKVIARNPNTVETLGTTTVICTDKTGTITENKMELSAIYDFSEHKISDYSKEPYTLNNVVEYAMWASETAPFDPMEISLHQVYSSVAGNDKRPGYTLVHEYPLGGTPPIMTHVFSDNKASHIIACKGSVEGVLKQSKLSKEQKNEILQISSQFTTRGFRVLAVATSELRLSELPQSQFDFVFDFIGLVAFYDPPKKNIGGVLRQFYQAGINVKMITGDHSETAANIAGQIHLKDSTVVLTGKEVLDMDQQQLCEKVKVVNVFARMFPEAKVKVVEALKANGNIVAMTGDGVNDGPALKAAHIGVAMGMRGSEVAKGAASLILVDDDLSRMVDAIALGRRIYENLKKAIQYIISIHIPAILIITIPLLMFWKYTDFFYPVHIIFLELVMGPTCSIIFENEPIEANSMSKPPRKMKATFFSWRELSLSTIQGLMITVGCLSIGYYFMQHGNSESEVRTIIYATLIFSNLFLTLVNRSFYYSIFTTIRYKNNLLPIILLISLAVLFLSIYMPVIQNLFQFAALKFSTVLYCFMTAFVAVMWIEVFKFYKRKRAK
jgi:Ca2+-transporting ATPase